MPLRSLIRVALALLAVAAAAPTADAAPGARPSILLILTDDQRWDTLRYMPTVERELVDHGVTFGQAFATNPLCCPSRATILTGRYSHTTRVYSNLPPYGGSQWFDDDSTIATWLHDAGYRTGYVGKYLNEYGGSWAPPGLERWFTPPGWDTWLGYGGGYYDWGLVVGGLIGRAGDDAADYSTDVFTNEAVSFVEHAGSDPFFLVYAPYAPHMPAIPAPRHEGAFAAEPDWRPPSWNEADVGDKPAWLRSRPPVDDEAVERSDDLRRRQLETLLAVDEGVGRLMGALRASGRLEDTLVMFASDNGLLWGEHRLANRKSAAYEESIRIPLVVRYDRVLEGARTNTRNIVANVDLAQTFADAAGIRAPDAEGRSLMPLLVGPAPRSEWRARLLLEHLQGEEGAAVEIPSYCGTRGARFKYVLYATGEEELYDLARDPYELRNLADDPRFRPARDVARRWLRAHCRPAPPGFPAGLLAP